MALFDLTDGVLAAMLPEARATLLSTEDERPGTLLSIFENTGNRSTRTFQVPFADVPATVQFYLGYAELIGGAIVRHQPVRDPVYRQNFAARAEVRTLGQLGAVYDPDNTPIISANESVQALATVYFECSRWDCGVLAGDADDVMLEAQPITDETERYCFKDVSAAREVYAAIQGTFVWAKPDGTPNVDKSVGSSIPVMVSYIDVRVTWVGVPIDAVPVTALDYCQGRVNSSTMKLPSRPDGQAYYDAETLLLQSYTITEGYFADGTRSATLTFFFRYRKSGWNVYLSPTGTFLRVFRKATQSLSSDQWVGIYELATTPNVPVTDAYSLLFKPEGS